MTHSVRRSLLWTPRTLTILFALFLGVFALDVFGEDRSGWGILAALTMHLIPSAIVLAVLAISWRREWIGGIAFLLVGAGYIFMAWGRGFHWTAYLAISGPLLLVGILFLVNWKYRTELHPRT